LCERIAENTIHLKNSNENETQFKALFKKFKFIKEIEIKEENYSCIKDFFIKSLVERQKYLEKVLFIGEIDRNVFIEFAKNCGQKLKYFDLILSFWDNNYRLFNEEELIQVLQNSPNLRTIVMDFDRLESLHKQYLPKLEEITFCAHFRKSQILEN
jgi:hypothetical protein